MKVILERSSTGSAIRSRPADDTAIVNLTRMSRPDGAPYESMRLESEMDGGINEVIDAICDSVISPRSGVVGLARSTDIERMFR